MNEWKWSSETSIHVWLVSIHFLFRAGILILLFNWTGKKSLLQRVIILIPCLDNERPNVICDHYTCTLGLLTVRHVIWIRSRHLKSCQNNSYNRTCVSKYQIYLHSISKHRPLPIYYIIRFSCASHLCRWDIYLKRQSI